MSLNTLSFKGFAFTENPQSAQYVSVRTGPGDEDFANVLLSDLRTFITAEVEVRLAALEAGESGGAKPSIWPVARTMTLSGPVTGSASFDGSQNFSLSTSIADGALTIAKTNGLQGQLTTLQTNIDGKAPLVHSHIGTQPNLNSIPGGVLPVGAVVGSGSTALDGFTNPLYLSAYDGQTRASQLIFDNATDEVGFRRFTAGNWRSVRKIWTEANFDPSVKASTGGNTFTGLNTFANGRVVIRADVAATQSALQFQDESAVLQGMVYYNRTDKAMTIYTAAGDGTSKVMSLKPDGLYWDAKKVWHAGNFDPAAYNYMTVTPTLYNASAGINCDNLVVGSKAFVHNANTNTPGTAATYWHIETVQLGDVAGSLIQRAYAADSSEMWTRVYNAGWKAWRRVWTSENFNPVNKLDANAAAASAQKLTIARTIALTGVVTGSVSFDGSANASITTAFSGDVTNSAGGFIVAGGGAVQVNNPNASSASIKMDWNGDMPRLRIGGSGTGSNATFLIVGQSEKTRMSLDLNGNAMFAGNILANGDKTVYHSGNLDLTDFTRVSTTNLGKVGSTTVGPGTLNSPAAWSNLPTGFSSFVLNTVGTANGAPGDGYGYFHKIAQRDTQGGWAGIWLPHLFNGAQVTQAYLGGANDSTSYARWAKIWNDTNHGAGSGLDADLLDGKDGGYYLSKDTLLGGANMARNGSFESQYNSGRPYFWNLGGNAAGRSGSFVVSAAGPAGVGFRIDATSATAGQYIDMMQPLLEDGTDPRPTCVPNRPYTASCDFRGTEGAMVRMYIQFYDSSDTVIATATSQDFTASATNFQRAFVTGRAPANAVKLRMFCPRLFNTGLGGGTVALFVEYAGAAIQEGDSYSTFQYPGTSFFRNDISNYQDVRFASGNGRGVRFWDSDQYKISMAAATDTTWGGQIAGETTSDYNMYFRMSGGTNRGFVFETAYATKLLSINPNGVRSVVNVTAPTFIGALTGNASTASSAAKLTTARTINGVAFDGTANITITSSWGGGAVNNVINIFNGTNNAQSSMLTMAWSGGSTRWAHVFESDASYALYSYNATGGNPMRVASFANLASGGNLFSAFNVEGGIRSQGASAGYNLADREGGSNGDWSLYASGNALRFWFGGTGNNGDKVSISSGGEVGAQRARLIAEAPLHFSFGNGSLSRIYAWGTNGAGDDIFNVLRNGTSNYNLFWNGNMEASNTLRVGNQIYLNGGWFRSQQSGTGWYHEAHGGGWMMQDNTWVRNYGGKSVLIAGAGGQTGDLRLESTSPTVTFYDTDQGTTHWLHCNDNQIGFLANNAFAWATYRNPSNDWVCTGNIVAYASDERLKKVIVDAKRSVVSDFFDRFRVREFDWDYEAIAELNPNFHPSADHELGGIAQEIEEVYPLMVTEHDSTGIKTVLWEKAVPLLIAEVQELRKLKPVMDELLQRITALEALKGGG